MRRVVPFYVMKFVTDTCICSYICITLYCVFCFPFFFSLVPLCTFVTFWLILMGTCVSLLRKL